MKFERGLPAVPPVKTMHVMKLGTTHLAFVPCPDRNQWITCSTHYCVKAERRVLCEGLMCRCKGRGVGWAIDVRTYVPGQAVVLYNRVGNTYCLPGDADPTEVIVCFTPHALPALYDLPPNSVFEIWRGGNKKNGPVHAKGYPHCLKLLPWKKTYPVEESLKNTFGIRS